MEAPQSRSYVRALWIIWQPNRCTSPPRDFQQYSNWSRGKRAQSDPTYLSSLVVKLWLWLCSICNSKAHTFHTTVGRESKSWRHVVLKSNTNAAQLTMVADPWSTTEKCHTGQSAYYLVLRRKYSKLHLANSLAGKTKAAFCHATTASQSKLVFTDQQICQHHSGSRRKQTHFQLSEWEHNGLAQKRLQWPVTVCISITHTGHSLEATTGASAAFSLGATVQGSWAPRRSAPTHYRPRKKQYWGDDHQKAGGNVGSTVEV